MKLAFFKVIYPYVLCGFLEQIDFFISLFYLWSISVLLYFISINFLWLIKEVEYFSKKQWLSICY